MLKLKPSYAWQASIMSIHIWNIYISPDIFLLMWDSLFSLEMFCLENKRWKERHDKWFQIFRGLPCGKRRWVCAQQFQKAAPGTGLGSVLQGASPNLPVFEQKSLQHRGRAWWGSQLHSSHPWRLPGPKPDFSAGPLGRQLLGAELCPLQIPVLKP